MEKTNGECLCGAVKFSADLPTKEFQACHCQQCQRWTGGSPLLAIRAEDVEVTGGENIRAYHASEWGERASCAKCGSILYWTMKGKPPAFLALGLFAGQTGFELTEEIFTDHRPSWLPEWPDASQSTEAEQISKFDAYMAKQNE